MSSTVTPLITAELAAGSFVPVELIGWTPTGHVQVKHTVIVGAVAPAVCGMFRPVPAMKLVHSGGRHALAEVLAGLPRAGA
jgi:hypothetical protein